MANIMSQVKLKNRTSRNAFDLSRKNAFTAKVGELLPVACVECIPGDKFKARVQHFTRTMPVSTAAYTRIREYYDWFFVPTNLLWNKFNTWVTQMTDDVQHAVSATQAKQLSDMHPYFTLDSVGNYVKYLETNSRKSIFGDSRAALTAKLLSYLGYGDFYDYVTGSVTYLNNVNLNPFPLLAYQKVCSDYFRDSQWEKANPRAFNVDYIYDDALIPVSSIQNATSNSYNMFDLRYSNWNRDLFMGTLPNSQYGESASLMASSLTPYNEFARFTTTGNNPGLSSNVQTASQYVAVDNLQTTVLYSANKTDSPLRFVLGSEQLAKLRTSLGIEGFSVLALRQAEALQKWKEITQSQQQDYKSQIEAHFGVSMSDAYSERCRYIDGSVSNLDISEVVNQNITSDNAADIAGKGVGVGNGSINFSTDVHGYLICIYHAVPLLDYSTKGIDKMNMKTLATDYAIPELDATGMVSVPITELTNSPLINTQYRNHLLGYAPRYYDYKTAVDKVNGAFTRSYSTWVAPVTPEYISSMISPVLANDIAFGYIWRKVNPHILNPIFSAEADGSVDTDQLLVNSSFEITAVRNLDRNGLPY